MKTKLTHKKYHLGHILLVASLSILLGGGLMGIFYALVLEPEVSAETVGDRVTRGFGENRISLEEMQEYAVGDSTILIFKKNKRLVKRSKWGIVPKASLSDYNSKYKDWKDGIIIEETDDYSIQLFKAIITKVKT